MRRTLGAVCAAAVAAAAVAQAPLNLTVLSTEFAQAHGAACLDGSPPAFYSLVQDPTKCVPSHANVTATRPSANGAAQGRALSCMLCIACLKL
jgi:hypothetical protein